MSIIEKIKIKNMGFVTTEEELEEIVKYHRLTRLLVRCGNGRFVAPAQDVAHFVKIINESGADHVRDISIPIS